MKRYLHITLTMLVSVIILTLTCCERHTEAWQKMDLAESLMETQPDSSLVILNAINKDNLGGKEESARYALLKSMALDKNYIDTTDFKVLQPAIDYYLKKGTPDEKIRTYYYQGRIYQNQGDDDKAMGAYFKGKDLIQLSNDTLVAARLLTAQGALFYKQYKYSEYVENALRCIELYNKSDQGGALLRAYAKALNGSILLKDKERADSLLKVCMPLFQKAEGNQDFIQPQILMYNLVFGDSNDIRSILAIYQSPDCSDEVLLDLSYGYAIVGEGRKAKEYFEKIDTLGYLAKSLKYLSIKSYVLEASGDLKSALIQSRTYNRSLEDFHRHLFSQDLLFAEKRHELEIQNYKSIQNKDRIISVTICILLLLGLIIFYLYFRNRLIEAKRKLAEEEVKKLDLERISLEAKKEALELVTHNAELEASKKALETENLKLRISQLEDESETLKELLEKSKLSEPVRLAVKERIDLLNEILAGKVSNSENYEKPYQDWVASLTSDKEKFMRSTQLALRASYPKMFESLESCGLTDNEIDYACLYAIGLRGKEIGEYTQNKGHYHLSSQIRKKLGLSDKDTNIGNYIRRLMKDS